MPLRAHPDHNPWNGVSENFFLYDVSPIEWLAAWLDKVNHDTAVARPQHARRNFDHSGKVGRIANRPDAFRRVSHICPKVRCSPKRARQRLQFVRLGFTAEALHVPRPVEVIACVNVPAWIVTRHHDEEFTLPGTPDP